MATQKLAQKPQVVVDTTWMVPGALCWIDTDPPINAPPKTIVFDPAVVVSFDANMVTVKVGNTQHKHKPQVVLERAVQHKNAYSNGHEDMVNMETLNDAELLNNIIVRFAQDLIFTYVGPTLLVVNPFKAIKGMFDADVRIKYATHIVSAKGNPLAYKELEPHVYAIAAEAYRSLFENEKNQAIVISGESGAGKTENAKFCMNLLTSIGHIQLAPIKDEKKQVSKLASQVQETVNATSSVGIEDKILGCNPILESFGNAKTVRNNNSSRFGKYVRIVVNQATKKIKGAEIVNYLLEKSRITNQGINERNFHIFYHVLSGLSADELMKFKLATAKGKIPPEEFDYLKSSQCYTASGINDVALFEEIKQSIRMLGFQTFYENILSIVAAVLLLGNVKFDESTYGNDTPCSLKDLVAFQAVADLLEMNIDDLKAAVTLKQVTVQKQIIQSPLHPDECKAAKDSLAKEMYDRLFNWLVVKLNQTIAPQYQEGLKYVSVGLLDIYGFEVFEKNGFEQMMINYTNEKLHQLYISYVFKEEERVFAKEGLQEYSGQIVFHDNKDVIELLDKPPTGIFKLLDESCTVKSTDESLLQKIKHCHKTNPLIQNPKMPSNPTFIIVHTAKDVEYTIHGFRDKNKDELSVLTQQKMQLSKNDLLRTLFVQNPEDANKKADKFLATKIKKEMVELMTELNSCDVHFVRCIKPNEEKQFNVISQNMTLKQIRYLGVLDSLKVRKESYPIRRNYQAFYKRYGDITRNKAYPTLIKENTNFRDLTIAMFKEYFSELNTTMVLMGDTRVFLKQDALNRIEEVYKRIMVDKHQKVMKLQRGWKIYKIKRGLTRLVRIATMLRNRARQAKAALLRKKQLKAVIRLEIWWAYVLKKKRTKKYKDSSKLFQLFIKRYFYMVKIARQKRAVEKLQRFTRSYLRKKNQILREHISKILELVVDKAWRAIRDNAATRIQKVWRGYRCRKMHSKEIQLIKEAWRHKLIQRNVLKIQRAGRSYIIRKRERILHRAAYYIQGYFRMRWLSDMFQRMRRAIVQIQRRVRTFLAKKHAYNAKYSRYILPWEIEVNHQRQQETNSLWQSRNDISPLSPYQTFDQSFTSGWASPTRYHDEGATPSLFDQCLLQWKPKLPKMALFMFPIDLDILCDLNMSYNPNYSYSRTLLNIIVQQLRKDHPIQTVHVTEQSTVCVTVGGGSVYEFGEGKLIGKQSEQLVSHADDVQDGVEKITLPDSIRVRSVASSQQHLLMVTHDGTLLQYGDPLEMWPSIELRPVVHHYPTQSCAASSIGSFLVSQSRLFTWPLIGEEVQILEPVEVRINARVKNVAAGNQFAVMLCENGLLYSWGENLEGELGLGDTHVRQQPTFIAGLRGDKVVQLSCGLKHVAVKSSLNRVYTWGWGELGQLGHQDFRNENSPRAITLTGRQTALWVQCGRTSTLVINDKKQVQWCGTNSMLKYQSTLQPFKIESRSLVLNSPHYVPVRIISTYSKTLEITYITFVNTVTCLEDNHNKKHKLITKLIELWAESPDPCSVDPPFNQALANHVYEVSMRKAALPFNRRAIHSFFKVQQSRQREESDIHFERVRFELEHASRAGPMDLAHISEEGSRANSITLDRNTKLSIIKARLLELETLPQEHWTDEDIDFIKTVYQSKVNKLLQSLQ